MADQFIRIGSIEDVQGYDDVDYDAAIETAAPIKAGDPVDPNDVVTLGSMTSDLTGYFLLAGRTGGQLGIGGLAVTDTLGLQGTAGNGTLASPAIQFKVGNNGGTVAGTFLNNGSLGLGVAAPTAVLHLKAGTVTAGTGPLKLTTGPLVTTPEVGLLEFYEDRWYITGAARRVISRACCTIVTSTTVANTVNETTLWTGPVPANILGIGKMYKIEGMGQFSTHDAADTITIRVKIGTTTIITFASTAGTVSNKAWHVDAWITLRTLGATGTVSAHGHVTLNATSVHANTPSTIIDTTAAENLTITAQWDSADAGNTIQIDQAVMKVLN